MSHFTANSTNWSYVPIFSVTSLENFKSSLLNSLCIFCHRFTLFSSFLRALGFFFKVSTDCLLNTGVLDLRHSGFMITDPPEQCAGEFTMLVLAGLGVESGWYIWCWWQVWWWGNRSWQGRIPNLTY